MMNRTSFLQLYPCDKINLIYSMIEFNQNHTVSESYLRNMQLIGRASDRYEEGSGFSNSLIIQQVIIKEIITVTVVWKSDLN